MADPPVLDPEQIPGFVQSDDDLYRWRLCMGVAQQIAGTDDLMLAEMMYADPRIPTYEPEQVQEWTEEQRERSIAVRKAKAAEKKAEKDLDKLGPIGNAPEPKELSPSQMADRGYDRIPEKGEMAKDVLGDAYDTKELHTPEGDLSHLLPEDRYTPERVSAVHDPIVAATTDHPSQERPRVLIVAGGPASGKTTLLNREPQLMPEDASHLDADAIRAGGGDTGHKGIPEAVDMLDDKDPYAAWGSQWEAGDIFEKAEKAAIEKRTNMVMDVTGNARQRDFQRQLDRLHDAGYRIDVMYVSVPTEQAVKQNIHRAETEGRYVPTPIVREKHRLVAQNFRDYVKDVPYLDSVRVYDPERGMVAHRDKDTLQMIPTNEEGYAAWMAKADEPPVENLPRRGTPLEEAELQRYGEPSPRRFVIGVPFEFEDREEADRERKRLSAEARRRP